MLRIATSMGALDFGQLCHVYRQSSEEKGAQDYPDLDVGLQVLRAEQDFYEYLQCFLKEPDAFYAVWIDDDRYVSALRIEPYKDGVLLEGLETAPDARRNGYAAALIYATCSYLAEHGSVTVYSHVHKKNAASIAVHRNAGFEICADHAVFVDGSVFQNAYTLQLKIK